MTEYSGDSVSVIREIVSIFSEGTAATNISVSNSSKCSWTYESTSAFDSAFNSSAKLIFSEGALCGIRRKSKIAAAAADDQSTIRFKYGTRFKGVFCSASIFCAMDSKYSGFGVSIVRFCRYSKMSRFVFIRVLIVDFINGLISAEEILLFFAERDENWP